MYRLAADIFNDAAMILDCLSPTLPKSSRVMLLSLSSVLRSLCGVAAGSSKASLSAHFATQGNLGELNAVGKFSAYPNTTNDFVEGFKPGNHHISHGNVGWEPSRISHLVPSGNMDCNDFSPGYSSRHELSSCQSRQHAYSQQATDKSCILHFIFKILPIHG